MKPTTKPPPRKYRVTIHRDGQDILSVTTPTARWALEWATRLERRVPGAAADICPVW